MARQSAVIGDWANFSELKPLTSFAPRKFAAPPSKKIRTTERLDRDRIRIVFSDGSDQIIHKMDRR